MDCFYPSKSDVVGASLSGLPQPPLKYSDAIDFQKLLDTVLGK